MSSTHAPQDVTLACRFCQTKNRIPVARAMDDLSQCKCGSCRAALLRVNGEPLMDIHNDDLAHPWDREALKALQSVPMLDMIIQKVMGSTLDKLRQFQFMGSAVRVSERQAPRLWRLYLEAAGRIDVDPPPLYMIQTPVVNAFASGAGRPTLAVTTGLLDLLDDRQICGVLGHELTHVRLDHVTYRTLALLIANGALSALNFLGLAGLVLTPIRIALMKWYQMSELSADRGELLTTGSMDTFVRTHMTIAGGSSRFADELDVGEFIEQANEAEALRSKDLLISVMDLMDSTQRSHPLTVWRVHHGMRWAQTPRFFELLAGETRGILT